MKHKILSLLVLLLTAATGAWAAAYTVTDLKVGDIVKIGDVLTIPAGATECRLTYDGKYLWISSNENPSWELARGNAAGTYPDQSVVAADGTNFVFSQTGSVKGVTNNWVDDHYEYGSFPYNDDGLKVSAVDFTDNIAPKITFELAEPDIIVAWDTSTNTGTFLMPGSDVVLTPIYAPTKVTLAVNDTKMGSVKMAGESKVEWTKSTWSGWTRNDMTYTDGNITMTVTSTPNEPSPSLVEYDNSNNALWFFINENDEGGTLTISSDEGDISRIELSMTEDYFEQQVYGDIYYGNPHIRPLDGWTFDGKSAVWEGEATNGLVLTSCSTTVEKITFYKGGGIPEGVTVNGDGTFTVAQKATVKLKATPNEGYKLKCWSDDDNCTDLEREITIEPGEEDMTITAIFEELIYTATFKAANANTIEDGKATVKVGGEEKTLSEGKIEGVKTAQEVKLNAAQGYKLRKVEVKKTTVEKVELNFGTWSLDITGCTTWEQVVAQNPYSIECDGNYVKIKDQPYYLVYNSNYQRVDKSEEPKTDVEYNWIYGE
jgi:hypothetical protein